jgi:adenylosuccinate synthase
LPQGEKLYEKIVSAYEALDAGAEDLDGSSKLFEGNTTDALVAVGLNGQYSIVLNKLETMGCITRLQRGNAYQVSKITLHGPPSWEEYKAAGPTYGTKAEMTSDKQRINDLNNRITALEDRLVAVEDDLSA